MNLLQKYKPMGTNCYQYCCLNWFNWIIWYAAYCCFYYSGCTYIRVWTPILPTHQILLHLWTQTAFSLINTVKHEIKISPNWRKIRKNELYFAERLETASWYVTHDIELIWLFRRKCDMFIFVQFSAEIAMMRESDMFISTV